MAMPYRGLASAVIMWDVESVVSVDGNPYPYLYIYAYVRRALSMVSKAGLESSRELAPLNSRLARKE